MTCLVVGRMNGFGNNGRALCEHRMPSTNLSGWCIDVSIEVIESHKEDDTKIKTTGSVAFEIPKIKASDVTPLNPAIEVVAPGIHVNVINLATLEELKGALFQKGSVVNLSKQTSLSPHYPLQVAHRYVLVAHSGESADDSRLASLNKSLECMLCQPQDLLDVQVNLKGYIAIMLPDISWTNSKECHQSHAGSVATQPALFPCLAIKYRSIVGSKCNHSK
jgi:hypothetical protein